MQQDELECRILYAIIVAGKSARFADKAFRRLFGVVTTSPFETVRQWIEQGILVDKLRAARVGNYGKIERAYRELVNAELNLTTCLPEHLEAIHGVGPKTARFFVLWTRPDARYAVLDVHVLRWLREQGHDVPRATPPPKRYAEIEKLYLNLVDRLGLTPRQVDEQVWMNGSQFGKYNPDDLRPVE